MMIRQPGLKEIIQIGANYLAGMMSIITVRL
jgi:hypothetical protein